MSDKAAPEPVESIAKQIDDIVFRCFAQGQYLGTADENGKLNPDLEPDEPIDRTEANKALARLLVQAKLEELVRLRDMPDSELESYGNEIEDRIAFLQSQLEGAAPELAIDKQDVRTEVKRKDGGTQHEGN